LLQSQTRQSQQYLANEGSPNDDDLHFADATPLRLPE